MIGYQYYWSIYPDTSQSVVMLTPQPWAPRREAITTIIKVFGMTRSGIKRTASRTRAGRSVYSYYSESKPDPYKT